MATRASRADTLTPNGKTPELFSDFLNSFAKTPFGNQLGRVTNEQAVSQSIRNLILTMYGERLFTPYVGANVYNSLFELNTIVNTNSIELDIQNTIKNSEPRANIIQIDVVMDYQNENEILINIVYNLINNINPINLSVVLKRVR